MSLDREMEQWRQGWTASTKTDDVGEGGFRGDAIAQETRLRKKLWVDLAVGPGFLVGSLVVAAVDRSPEMWLWAAVIWVTTIVASSFMLWNWQMLWRSSSESVSDYIEGYRNRALASLRTTKFAFSFLVVQDFISISWFILDLSGGRIEAVRFCVGLGLIAVVNILFVWGITIRRRQALNEIEAVRMLTET